MNDRFKFRVWKKAENKMVENVTYLNPLLLDEDIAKDTAKNYVIMQCTGLKDKNGKLIYEADIVKHGLHNCLIEWYKGGFWVNGFINGAKWEMHQYYNTLEAIGNIYENKDLLNENN